MRARILVVDDEPDIRSGLAGLLQGAEYDVDTAATMREARCKAAGQAWDVVISDERLPDGEGAVLLAELALAGRAGGRVLMSAFQDFDALMRGVNAARIDHFVRKPFDPLHMLATVDRVLRDRERRGLPPSR